MAMKPVPMHVLSRAYGSYLRRKLYLRKREHNRTKKANSRRKKHNSRPPIVSNITSLYPYQGPFQKLHNDFWLQQKKLGPMTSSKESTAQMATAHKKSTTQLAIYNMRTPDLQQFKFEVPLKLQADEPIIEHATRSRWRSPARELVRFFAFPPEVRSRIWKFATSNDARVIEMRHPDLHVYRQKDGRLIARPETLIKPRALLSACKEAREVQIQALRQVDLGTQVDYLINLDADVVYFGPESYWYNEVIWTPTLGMTEEQPSQRRQEWNHWRAGEETGNEATMEMDSQFIAPSRLYLDQYHPLLANKEYKSERQQILNVAFDLEFWNETNERRTGGQMDLLAQFPNALKVVLAAGDVGTSYNIKRKDQGPEWLMNEKYEHTLTTHQTTAQPGVIHTGQVEFLPGAVQTPLEPEVVKAINRASRQIPVPNLVTMCVTRGGSYNGHKSRFAFGSDNEDDEDDKADFTFEQISDEGMEKGLNASIKLFRFEEELNALRFDEENDTEAYLTGLRKELPDEQQAKRFHATAISEAQLTRVANDTSSESTFDVNAAKDFMEVDSLVPTGSQPNQTQPSTRREANKINSSNYQNDKRSNNTSNQGPPTSSSEPSSPYTTSARSSTASSRNTSPAKCTLRKSNSPPPKTTSLQGYEVLGIHSSIIHYGTLSYRVRFKSEAVTGNTKYARTEPMFVENPYCGSLIKLFHEENPGAPGLEEERKSERKAWGSVTRGGKKVVCGGSETSGSGNNERQLGLDVGVSPVIEHTDVQGA